MTLGNSSRLKTLRAFTLVELLVAMGLGSVVAGGILLLLCQTSAEQMNGFADYTVEEKAYILQSQLTSCLRSMSASEGMTPNYSSGCYDSHGNLLGYQSIFVFYPTNGGYITGNINYNSSNGVVTYTTNILAATAQQVWMTNTSTAALTQLYFTTSYNLDGSQNSSLINVTFDMNDHGFSQQGATNNPTSICRNFTVQMRNDY